jgi:acetoin utilization protein AcuB
MRPEKSEDLMRVQDVMTRNVRTISPLTPADVAWNEMRRLGIHHLVVTTDTHIGGLLSDRDAGGRRGAALRKDHTVSDLMTDNVVTVPPQMTVRRAANLMRGRSIGCLVVVDQQRVIGILTVADLLELIGRGADRGVVSTTRRTLSHRTPHRHKASGTGLW